MRHKHLQFGRGFRVVLGDERSQAAQMTLVPGDTEGGPENRHRGADQWLYVVSDTVGEFPYGTDRPEPGWDGRPRQAKSRGSGEPGEFDSSIVSGEGLALVGGERVELREGTLVLIQRGE